MRNPLARLAKRDPAKPTLRERAAALKAKAGRVLKPRPLPAGDEPDPTFKLIAAAQEAERLMNARHPGDNAPAGSWLVKEAEAVTNRRCATEEAARLAAFSTRPSTVAGLHALTTYACQRQAAWDDDMMEAMPGTTELLATIRESVGLLSGAKAAAAMPDAPADLQAACDWAVAHTKWMNATSRAEGWDDERLDAELDRNGAVWRRAIAEPSTDIATVAAKVRMFMRDWTNLRPEPDDDADRLIRAIMHDVLQASAVSEQASAAGLPDAERVVSAATSPDFTVVPLDGLFALADVYSSASRQFHIAAFWPKARAGKEQFASGIAIDEGDRFSHLLESAVAEMSRRKPKDEIEASQLREWQARLALASYDEQAAARVLAGVLNDTVVA